MKMKASSGQTNCDYFILLDFFNFIIPSISQVLLKLITPVIDFSSGLVAHGQ
jgi:hypothetical protein